jgi:sugar/nucleoside kinase (ribokinase family)
LRAVGVEAFRDWTAGWALCFPNADEARALGGAGELARRYDLVVLKHGLTGATLHRRDVAPQEVPGRPVQAVDPTGAGDAFAAGFLVARLRGDDDLDAARCAVGAAATVVTRPGGRPPPPART